MPQNEIIDDIHRYREDLARRCDFDLRKLVACLREQQAVREVAGRVVISPGRSDRLEASPVREEASEFI